MTGGMAGLGFTSIGRFAQPNVPIVISIATSQHQSTKHRGKMHI